MRRRRTVGVSRAWLVVRATEARGSGIQVTTAALRGPARVRSNVRAAPDAATLMTPPVPRGHLDGEAVEHLDATYRVGTSTATRRRSPFDAPQHPPRAPRVPRVHQPRATRRAPGRVVALDAARVRGAPRRARHARRLPDARVPHLELAQRTDPPGPPDRQRPRPVDAGGGARAARLRGQRLLAAAPRLRLRGRPGRRRRRRGAQRVRRPPLQRPRPQLVARLLRRGDHAGAAHRHRGPDVGRTPGAGAT